MAGGQWEVAELSFTNIAPGGQWEVAELSFDTTVTAGGQWEVAALTYDATASTPPVTFLISDTMGLTDGNTAVNEFSLAQAWTLTGSVGLTDQLKLFASPHLFIGLPPDDAGLTDYVLLVTDATSSLYKPPLGDTEYLSDNIAMDFGYGPVPATPAANLTTERLKRLFLLYSMNLPIPNNLSNSDLMYMYYSQRSGLAQNKGTLADHISAWLRARNYSSLYDYLEGQGIAGDMATKLRAFYNGFIPR